MEANHYTIELDVAFVEGEASTAAAIELAQGAAWQLVTHNGPAGGWPVYRFEGTAGQLLDVLVAYNEGDLQAALDDGHRMGVLTN